MTTANDIIVTSLKLIGQLGQGETASDADITDGLEALNTMLDSWRINRLNVYRLNEISFTLTANKSSYTIGDGGEFDTERPVNVQSAFIRQNSIDYPMYVLPKAAYDSISDKMIVSNLPYQLYYEPAYPLGTVFLYPVPSATNDLHMDVWQTLQQFNTLTEELSLPPGYERAIKYNLASEISPLFGVEAPPRVDRIAAQSLGDVRDVNLPDMTADVSEASLAGSGPRRYNIFADY